MDFWKLLTNKSISLFSGSYGFFTFMYSLVCRVCSPNVSERTRKIIKTSHFTIKTSQAPIKLSGTGIERSNPVMLVLDLAERPPLWMGQAHLLHQIDQLELIKLCEFKFTLNAFKFCKETWYCCIFFINSEFLKQNWQIKSFTFFLDPMDSLSSCILWFVVLERTRKIIKISNFTTKTCQATISNPNIRNMNRVVKSGYASSGSSENTPIVNGTSSPSSSDRSTSTNIVVRI